MKFGGRDGISSQQSVAVTLARIAVGLKALVFGMLDVLRGPSRGFVAVAVASEAAVCASFMDIDVERFYRDLKSCRSKSARYISASYMRDRFLV
jgi:hypothetical protein